MVQYQNCAPAQNFDTDLEVASDVGVIDQVSVGAISFPQEKLSINFEDQVEALGICEQTGAIISWRLTDGDGSAIELGFSECDKGVFVVSLGEEWKQFCDETLTLKAALGAKASSEIKLETICPL